VHYRALHVGDSPYCQFLEVQQIQKKLYLHKNAEEEKVKTSIVRESQQQDEALSKEN